MTDAKAAEKLCSKLVKLERWTSLSFQQIATFGSGTMWFRQNQESLRQFVSEIARRTISESDPRFQFKSDMETSKPYSHSSSYQTGSAFLPVPRTILRLWPTCMSGISAMSGMLLAGLRKVRLRFSQTASAPFPAVSFQHSHQNALFLSLRVMRVIRGSTASLGPCPTPSSLSLPFSPAVCVALRSCPLVRSDLFAR